MSALRIVFMGTPELAAASLEALLASKDFQIVASVTQPDRPKGRDLKLRASPVKELALKSGIPVLQPQRARAPEFILELQKFAPDLIAVAAFGQILPQSILDLPEHGCLNVHTSLLPKYRGAAPIQWAILNDEPETGITIMQMDAGLDTGAIITQEKTLITDTDTGQTLHDRLAEMGGALLVRTIPGFISGKLQPRPQPQEGATYAAKIKKQDGQIDWRQPARTIWNRVRGLTPWPGTFTWWNSPAGRPLIKIGEATPWERRGPGGPTSDQERTSKPGEILKADKEGIIVACGDNALIISVLQKEGGKRLTAQQFLTGNHLTPGQTFSSESDQVPSPRGRGPG
jgi:methionyl-tRNA formyltransferase